MSEQNTNNENKSLNYFISYATEDREIAKSIQNLLKKSLKVKDSSEELIKIFIDYNSMRCGEDEGYKHQIQEELKNAHRLIVIYTGQQKSSHSYTGWEVGYYDNENEHKSQVIKSKKIIFYTNETPKVLQEIQSLSIGISNEQLKMSPEDFRSEIKRNINENPIKRFLRDERGELEKNIFPNAPRNVDQCYFEANLDELITDAYVQIHEHLRKKTSKEYSAQKQFIIRAELPDIEKNNNELPDNATIIVPKSDIANAMTIFGTIPLNSDENITWGMFSKYIKSSPSSSFWKAAINSVISSVIIPSYPIDDNQLITSADGSSLYRIILSRYIAFFNNTYEFHLYFVKVYNSRSYGDQDTSNFLAAIEILSHFRFLFLEEYSHFNPRIIKAKFSKKNQYINLNEQIDIYMFFQQLIRELDFIAMQSRYKNLQEITQWLPIVNNANLLVEMLEKWKSLESGLRESINNLFNSRQNKDVDIESQINKILLILTQIIKEISPYNAFFLIKATEKLNNRVNNDFQNIIKTDSTLYARFNSKNND